MKKKVLWLICGTVTLLILIVILYLTCITEVQKTWLDMDVGSNYPHTTEPLYEGTVYSQHFIAQRSIVDEMQVRIITWEREYASEDQLTVSLVADSSGETVAECRVPLTECEDNQMYVLPFEGVRLTKGDWYTLRFSGNATEENHSVSLMLSNRGEPGWEFCVKNTEEDAMEENLSILVRGRGIFS